jgi:hypothetical protein
MSAKAPRVFISYSHDSEEHKNWVLALSTRLVSNGVDVILDQWDLTLGSDLPHFIESGLSAADRVLAVCTDQYVEKANLGTGGVGYEKMILSAQLMKNINADRIIPAVRSSSGPSLVPFFLLSKLYIDFRDDLEFEFKYSELIYDIHGEKIKPRPLLGKSPFLAGIAPVSPLISFTPGRYVSPAQSGVVTFDYSNNNGRYVVGAGNFAFETAWSRGGNTSIHAYNDPPSIRSVALAVGVADIHEIEDASIYDTSSRERDPKLGEIVVWQNTAGYYLATKIEKLQSRSHGHVQDELTFSYVIQGNKSASFRSDPPKA